MIIVTYNRTRLGSTDRNTGKNHGMLRCVVIVTYNRKIRKDTCMEPDIICWYMRRKKEGIWTIRKLFPIIIKWQGLRNKF